MFIKHVLRFSYCFLLCACTTLAPHSHFELPFNTIDKSSESGSLVFRTVVVRDQLSWEHLWLERIKNSPKLAMPSVEFSKNMVVGVILGTRPDSCYSVRIGKIFRVDEKIVVEYSEFGSGGGGFCTFGFTSPSHFVSVPYHSGPVEFIKKT